MLKTQTIHLAGRDLGNAVTITELSAMAADRHARAALREMGIEPAGGVVALALQHMRAVRKLGERGLQLLQPFVNVVAGEPIRDWTNIERVQQAAMLLHVGFLIGRETLDIPVSMRGEQILNSAPDVCVTFCSPFLAAVIESKHASYVELETILSTEDAFNLIEIINVRAVHDWHARKEE